MPLESTATECGVLNSPGPVPFLPQSRMYLPSGEILAGTGTQDAVEWLKKWYADGAKISEWPACQSDKDNWGRLIVADAAGVRYYERQPVSLWIEERFMSWGCGADLARAAMHCGRTAREAVEIASLYDNGCGNGVDVMELEPVAKLRVAGE